MVPNRLKPGRAQIRRRLQGLGISSTSFWHMPETGFYYTPLSAYVNNEAGKPSFPADPLDKRRKIWYNLFQNRTRVPE